MFSQPASCPPIHPPRQPASHPDSQSASQPITWSVSQAGRQGGWGQGAPHAPRAPPCVMLQSPCCPAPSGRTPVPAQSAKGVVRHGQAKHAVPCYRALRHVMAYRGMFAVARCSTRYGLLRRAVACSGMRCTRAWRGAMAWCAAVHVGVSRLLGAQAWGSQVDACTQLVWVGMRRPSIAHSFGECAPLPTPTPMRSLARILANTVSYCLRHPP